MSATAQHDGNGRLWERFELANINERIENIYQHFKSFEGQYSADLGLDENEQQKYLDKIRSSISSQLNELIQDLEAKFNERTKPWEEENIKLKSQLNNLKTRVRDLNNKNESNNKRKVELENKYNTLRNGLDQILGDSNNKNLNRIKKLQMENKQFEDERDTAVKELKKGKKLSDEMYGELQDKYDKLDGKYKKINTDRNNLLTDRDILKSKCLNLENIIKSNREMTHKTLTDLNNKLNSDLSALENKYNALENKNEKLNDECRVLSEKYNLEKEAFKRAIAKQSINDNIHSKNKEVLLSNSNREELNKLLRQLNDNHARELKKREADWVKAKNDSINTLDAQYNQIKLDKDNQIKSLRDSNDELKDNLKLCKTQIRRLKDENNKIDGLNDKIERLNDAVNGKCNEILALRTELSKYKILWRHFFGLDAPLKDEIEKVNDKLDKFENYHNIQSPIPKKKRRVIIEALSQWYVGKTNKDNKAPPLVFDAIPAPDDVHQRFELYNMSNKAIELKGFHLENGKGDSIELDARQVNPGSCVPIALKKKKHRFDILYNRSDPKYNNKSDSFCEFEKDERIYLCDSFDEKVQIFPNNTATRDLVCEDLAAFGGELGCPIFVKQLFDDDNGYKGFQFGNQTQKKIKLKNMYFCNKKGTLKVDIPFKSLPHNGIIKLIITDNVDHPKIGRNDLVVSSHCIDENASDDALLLCDAFGNSIQLYDLEGTGYDNLNEDNGTSGRQSTNVTNKSSSDCFIM